MSRWTRIGSGWWLDVLVPAPVLTLLTGCSLCFRGVPSSEELIPEPTVSPSGDRLVTFAVREGKLQLEVSNLNGSEGFDCNTGVNVGLHGWHSIKATGWHSDTLLWLNSSDVGIVTMQVDASRCYEVDTRRASSPGGHYVAFAGYDRWVVYLGDSHPGLLLLDEEVAKEAIGMELLEGDYSPAPVPIFPLAWTSDTEFHIQFRDGVTRHYAPEHLKRIEAEFSSGPWPQL